MHKMIEIGWRSPSFELVCSSHDTVNDLLLHIIVMIIVSFVCELAKFSKNPGQTWEPDFGR